MAEWMRGAVYVAGRFGTWKKGEVIAALQERSVRVVRKLAEADALVVGTRPGVAREQAEAMELPIVDGVAWMHNRGKTTREDEDEALRAHDAPHDALPTMSERDRVLSAIRAHLQRNFAADAALRESVLDEYSLVWIYAWSDLCALLDQWPDDDMEVPLAVASPALRWPAHLRHAQRGHLEQLVETGHAPTLQLAGALSPYYRNEVEAVMPLLQRPDLLPNVRHLDLSHLPQTRVLEILQSPVGQQITSLKITHQELDEDHLRQLIAAPVCDQLERLILHRSKMGAAGVRVLAERAWPALKLLHLHHGHFGDLGARALASMRLPALEDLRVGENHIHPPGVEALCGAAWFANLRVLDFEYNEVGETGAKQLAAVPFNRLEVLGLSANEIGDAGLAALANSPHLHTLRQLDVRGNHVNPRIGKAGVQALVQTEHLTGLERLHLGHNVFNGPALAPLLSAPSMANLSKLDLSFCGQLDLAKCTALLRKPPTAPLRFISLMCCKISDMRKAGELFQRVQWPDTLEHLDLYSLYLDLPALAELCSNPQVQRLRVLNLDGTPKTAKHVEILARTPFTRLEHLIMNAFRCPVDPERARLLVNAPWFPALRHLRITCTDTPESQEIMREAAERYGIQLDMS